MTNPFEILTGWLVDGQGGAILRDVVVKVQDGLIVSINTARENDFKRQDVADLSAHTLLPAFLVRFIKAAVSGLISMYSS